MKLLIKSAWGLDGHTARGVLDADLVGKNAIFSDPVCDATLRLELFTSDLQASLDFYGRVLGFDKEAERPGGYTPLAKGSVWGLTDFRVLDPDGYYWRVTSRG